MISAKQLRHLSETVEPKIHRRVVSPEDRAKAFVDYLQHVDLHAKPMCPPLVGRSLMSDLETVLKRSARQHFRRLHLTNIDLLEHIPSPIGNFSAKDDYLRIKGGLMSDRDDPYYAWCGFYGKEQFEANVVFVLADRLQKELVPLDYQVDEKCTLVSGSISYRIIISWDQKEG